MKYEIKVTQINDDGSREPFFFDDKETVGQLDVGGFVILGSTEMEEVVQSTVFIHNISLPEICMCFEGDEHLMKAAAVVLMEKLAHRSSQLAHDIAAGSSEEAKDAAK